MRPLNPTIKSMGGSTYSSYAEQLLQRAGPTYPLHIGDTWLEPALGCRMQDLSVDANPGLHRYSGVVGRLSLRESIAQKVMARTGYSTSRDEVLVTAGATGGLTALMGTLLQDGDEVLILAPFWPLIGGAVQAAGGVIKAVPAIGLGCTLDGLLSLLSTACSDDTVAIYWNTPNNPTGLNIPRAWLDALVEFARRHDLWIISDEVYEDYVYEGEHVYTRPLAPERTISAYSFSKAYGMAGNRVGYLVGPPEVISQTKKLTRLTVYSAPTAAQVAAERALELASEWVNTARQTYAEVGRRAAARLKVPAPQGSTFLFLDIRDSLDSTGVDGFLRRAVQRGVLVAPGTAFGPYPTYIRVCFTSIEPTRVLEGIEILAELLGIPPV